MLNEAAAKSKKAGGSRRAAKAHWSSFRYGNGPKVEREILNLNCPGLLDHLRVI